MNDALHPDKKWEIVLFQESDSYNANEVLINIQKTFPKYAYILHDRDKNDDGSFKKAHYHCYFRDNRTWTPEGIAYTLCVPKTSLRNVRKWSSAIRYLIHLDNPDKTPYSPDEIKANFLLRTYLVPDDDEEKAKQIYDYLCQHPNIPKTSLLNWVFENSLWSAFRRGYAVWDTILRENQNSKGDLKK